LIGYLKLTTSTYWTVWMICSENNWYKILSLPKPRLFISSLSLQTAPQTIKQDKSTRGKSIEKSIKSQRQPARKTAGKRIQSAPTNNDSKEGPHTPDNSGITTGGQTSTPTLDGSYFPQEIDASAIHAETSVLSIGEIKYYLSQKNFNFMPAMMLLM